MPQLPTSLERRLADLDIAMEKLGDWHEFAVQPKKVALVEKMEALVGATMDPNELSDTIKSLQEQWKTLCKGGKNEDQELWQRLQTAADKAFEPCREYFDKQAKEREQNAAKREQLIQQLQQYLDAYSWDSPVWNEVDKTLSVAKESWRSYWPVPRKQNNALQRQFDTVLSGIHAKLDAARRSNQEEKLKLIQQAEKLAANPDVSQAIEEAKQLQNQWKALGGTGGRGRSDDQKLWQQFRTACDTIFAKRQQEHQAEQQKFDAQRDRAQRALQRFDEILAASGSEFFEGRKTVDALEQELLSISDLPEKDLRKLKADCAAKRQQIESKAQAERNALAQEAWHRVFDIANDLRALEVAHYNQTATSELTEAFKAACDELQDWPNGTQAIIDARFKQLELEQARPDSQENEKQLRLLCVRKEICQGLESPEEDRALRMAYQVEQLQHGFGHTSRNRDQGSSLALEWLAVSAVDELSYNSLFERFTKDLFEV